MEKLITHLKDKTDDLENRSRRSNIRIINVPEQAEDYNVDLQRRRDEFRNVKRTLREMEVEYALIYPAQLRVKHLGSVKFFSTPAEAQRFLKDLPSE
ncbi:hypothetical protein JOB18_027576 [Solea senegalensis]|uniref:Uncharacterized protein n=1 Tax=Solea senegalensis TaxID=28829 RepID=A0AAV6RZ64_SOLSE|nr:hypothetical protein JOB18_027576 [Solea senegalensis]